MKKLKILAIFVITATLFALLAACGKATLAVPMDFSIDEENTLTWSAVTDARRYIVQIKNMESGEIEELNPRRETVSLANLAQGDYDIKVKAMGDGNAYGDSAWSETVFFQKGYETGLIYQFINGSTEYQIAQVGTAGGSVVIEDIYRGKPITKINDNAFKGNSRIEDIVIGSNVRTIGEYAFYNSAKLESVTIPDSVTEIGMSAFQSARRLKSIAIPAGVKVIREETFSYCIELEEINLGAVTEIKELAFKGCTSLTEIVIPDSVKTIGNDAFSENTGIKSLTLGSGLKTIGNFAFSSCWELEQVNFSASGNLLSIGDSAFWQCASLTEMELPYGLVTLGAYIFESAEKLKDVTIPASVRRVGTAAFNGTKLYSDAIMAGQQYVYADNWLVGCTQTIRDTITTIDATTFRQGVVGIADMVFFSTKKLATITLPSSVKVIGNYAFYGSQELWRVSTSNNSLEIIGDSAFAKSPVLKQLVFGDGLKEIGDNAFYDCRNLANSANENSFLPASVTSIGSYAFKGTALWGEPDSYGIVYVGKWLVGYNSDNVGVVPLRSGTVGIADYAFYKCNTLQSITGLYEVRYLGRGAFYDCTSLAVATLDNVRVIEDYTFYNCTSLFNITMPSNLVSIGRSAFYNCTALNGIDLEISQIKSIGDFAFYNAVNVKEINFGRQLESIGNYAFYNNSSITEVVLPNTVTEIGERAFSNCEDLQELDLGNGVITIGDSAFNGCTSLSTIIIPDSVKTIGSYAFYNAFGVTELTLGNSVEVIGGYAFYGLGQLTELYIPASVTYIGEHSFRGCGNLASIVISGSIERMGAHAFYGCDNMTVYTDLHSVPDKWSSSWNSVFRPIIWGCVLSEDRAYVVSVTITEETVLNANAINGISAPTARGYVFAGWATSADAENAQYTAEEISSVPYGTTLYAVWVTE